MHVYDEFLKKSYEMYKKDWCNARGYNLVSVSEAATHDDEYNGEMYASLEEFEDCEFSDESYMRSLLGEEYDDAMRKIKIEEKYPLLIGHSLTGRTQLRSIQDVADFICVHGQHGDLIITQRDGTPFIDTFGIYINKIADMEYREELLKVLIPMQHEVENDAFGDDESETDEEDINYRMEM